MKILQMEQHFHMEHQCGETVVGTGVWGEQQHLIGTGVEIETPQSALLEPLLADEETRTRFEVLEYLARIIM